MASGYLENAATITSTTATNNAGNNYGDGVLLSTPKNIELPSGGAHWSHLELIFQDTDNNNQTDLTVIVFLTWDAAGDDICAGPSTAATTVAGRTDEDRYMTVIDLDLTPILPPDGTAGDVYLWFSVTNLKDASSCSFKPPLIRARLHWNETPQV